ncbi:hypothetical protein ACFL51_02110 [Myxococcota bacterium]
MLNAALSSRYQYATDWCHANRTLRPFFSAKGDILDGRYNGPSDKTTSAVQPGGQIAVAAGEYEARLVIGKPVRLTGRCAELVTVRGTALLGVDMAPVSIVLGGSGTAISGVSLSGGGEGLTIEDVVGITVTEVQIIDAGEYGLWAGSAELSLVNVVASANHAAGMMLWGTEAELSLVVVRDSLPQQSDGALGFGVYASCIPTTGVCGTLRIHQSLIEANHAAGIALSGVEAELSSVVVRDTLPEQSNDGGGYGIHAECDTTTGVCGSLRLDRALLRANHTAGIAVFGYEADLSSAVVRDTLPRQSDGEAGIGLVAGCDTTALVCSSLRLGSALLQANHSLGIALSGAEAELSSVVVRDTLPRQSDGTFGHGLEAECDPETGVCGSLQIDHALLEANCTMGIALFGTGGDLSSLVVTDTLPPQDSGALNVALYSECPADTDACGSLRLDHALVRANHSMGIGLMGTEAELSSVVVSDTQAWPTGGAYGRGLEATCDPSTGVCGSLRLDHALLQTNRATGIYLAGTDADLSAITVRDTLPKQSDGTTGEGILAGCDPDIGVCGTLRLDQALIEANHTVGLFLSGVEAEVTSIIVRDTQPQQSDDTLGAGVYESCDLTAGVCGRLRLDQALIEANHTVGVGLLGTEAELSSVVVRDTQPQPSDGMVGYGLQVVCDPEPGVCGSLLATGSSIERSEMTGIAIFGVPAVLSGMAVKDTYQNQEGPFADDLGDGVYAGCFYDFCATLDLLECLVDSSFTAGLTVQGAAGSAQRSVVRNVLPRALDDAYGYGIQVEGEPGAPPTVFHVSESLIQDAEIAGILYYLAGGTVSGSRITGGQYTIVMNQGANPVIQDDNDLSGSIESDPTWANMDPAPVPEPLLPWE